MNISLQKLKAIILYFCECTNPKLLGKVRLMKLFYFLDFNHVKKYATPVTYDAYYNLEHGPIPSTIKNLVDSVADDPDSSLLSDTIFIQHNHGYDMHKVVPQRKLLESDKKLLSPTELEIIDQVCTRFKNSNAKSIEDASHAEAPWKTTAELNPIPYTLAVKDPDCQVDKEDITLAMSILAK